jgi:pimeloyl-ACP methyl ester carboxylesterase
MRLILRAVAAGLLVIAAAAGAYLAANRVPDQPVEALISKWAPPPSQFVDVAGMSVHLRDEGRRDDPAPVLLLHGTSSSLHTWDGWTSQLAGTRRVVRFDLPGFGLTGPVPDGNYTIENYARVTIAVMDKLGIRRAVLGGNSMGGYVAWATAVLYPDRVAALALVDSAGYPFESESVPIGFRIARTPVVNRLMEDVLPRRIVESSVRNVYGDPSKVTPELVDRYFDLLTRAGNRGALARRFEQTEPGALSRRISELHMPALILWGGRDRLIPPALAERFHREIKGSELVIFDALGHVPHEEDPEATVAAFARFLSRLPREDATSGRVKAGP